MSSVTLLLSSIFCKELQQHEQEQNENTTIIGG